MIFWRRTEVSFATLRPENSSRTCLEGHVLRGFHWWVQVPISQKRDVGHRRYLGELKKQTLGPGCGEQHGDGESDDDQGC